MTRRELEDLNARVLEKVRKMTVEEFIAWAKTSGIWTETGELTPEYGGEKYKTLPLQDTHRPLLGGEPDDQA